MPDDAEEDIEFDDETPAIAPPVVVTQAAPTLAKRDTEIKTEDFAPSLTVIGKKKQRIEVAVNAAANRAKWQILSSKCMTILSRRIDAIEESGMVPDAEEFSLLIETAKKIQGMSVMAYEGKRPISPGTGSEFERLALGVVQAASKGAAQGMANELGFSDKIAKMKALGRKGAQEITVEATEPPK